MKDVAIQGTVEDEALIQYVIDGIKDSNTNKAMLYGAAGLKQFREKLGIYEKFISRQPASIHSQISPKRSTNTQQVPIENKIILKCYNCGSKGHKSTNCNNKEKGTKCFKCNNFGHIAKNCKSEVVNQKERNVNCLSIERRSHKKLKIDDHEFNALIDTENNKSRAEKLQCLMALINRLCSINHTNQDYLKTLKMQLEKSNEELKCRNELDSIEKSKREEEYEKMKAELIEVTKRFKDTKLVHETEQRNLHEEISKLQEENERINEDLQNQKKNTCLIRRKLAEITNQLHKEHKEKELLQESYDKVNLDLKNLSQRYTEDMS